MHAPKCDPRSPFFCCAFVRSLALTLALPALVGCAAPAAVDDESWAAEVMAPVPPPPSVDGWYSVALPGKQATEYRRTLQ